MVPPWPINEKDIMTNQTWLEAKMAEFDRRTDAGNYPRVNYDIVPNTDTLLDEKEYLESDFKINDEKVKDFIRTALQDLAKELVGSVPELDVPSLMTQNDRGWNKARSALIARAKELGVGGEL